MNFKHESLQVFVLSPPPPYWWRGRRSRGRSLRPAELLLLRCSRRPSPATQHTGKLRVSRTAKRIFSSVCLLITWTTVDFKSWFMFLFTWPGDRCVWCTSGFNSSYNSARHHVGHVKHWLCLILQVTLLCHRGIIQLKPGTSPGPQSPDPFFQYVSWDEGSGSVRSLRAAGNWR